MVMAKVNIYQPLAASEKDSHILSSFLKGPLVGIQ